MLLAGILGAARPAGALESDPVAVDESIALTIGNFEISRYILDKNYNQFVAAYRAKSGSHPSSTETSAWFRRFIARQALCACLVETGYLDRPEIQRAVSRMARQILTQVDGPLYEALVPPDNLDAARLRKLHEIATRVFDIVVVRFDDTEVSTRHLGAAVSPEELVGVVRALMGNGEHSGFDIHVGPSAWPHGAFQEIADIIPETPRGGVIGPVAGGLGIYYLLVRGETTRALPDFETTREEWERFVRRMQRNLFQRVRRRQILHECGFQADLTAMAELAARLRPANDQPHTIDENGTFADTDIPIATYNTAGGRQLITDRNFVLHFNQRIVRSMPRDAVALVRAVEDLVVEQADYAAAIAARLDQQPKFVQDRRNFELKEALTLYEQEVLIPQITISPVEMQTRYSVTGQRYATTNEATGALYKFSSDAQATAALHRLIQGESETVIKLAARILDPVVIRRDGPPLDPERPNALLLAMFDGRPFGPFRHEGQATIFVKQSSGPTTIPSLSNIEGAIRQEILREKLDAREMQLFEESSNHYVLRVHFSFSEYGIENPLDKR